LKESVTTIDFTRIGSLLIHNALTAHTMLLFYEKTSFFDLFIQKGVKKVF